MKDTRDRFGLEEYETICECTVDEDGQVELKCRDTCEICIDNDESECFSRTNTIYNAFRWYAEQRFRECHASSKYEICYDIPSVTQCKSQAHCRAEVSINGEMCQSVTLCSGPKTPSGRIIRQPFFQADCSNILDGAIVDYCGEWLEDNYPAPFAVYDKDEDLHFEVPVRKGFCTGEFTS